ncbi:hypothetical protein HHK36_011255 [Tetracentron sinense]|uniref:Uncharacterized protein n=1 Tax=Tetracentron sinense TaxID=13715 RepID=A0A835DFZ9_TETSI|nr:hypothetical protein HHK36_011255 [Tetracentron sinense]
MGALASDFKQLKIIPRITDVFEISHKIWGEDSVQQRNSNSSAKDPSTTVKKKDKLKTLPGTSVVGNGEELVVPKKVSVEEKSKILAVLRNGEEILVVE